MIDLAYLAKCGVSAAAYKKIFSQPKEKMTKRQQARIDLISNRIRDGFSNSIQDHQAYQSIDLSYEISFNQTASTLVRHILSKGDMKPDEVMAELKAYGLSESELFLTVPVPGQPGQTMQMINPPVLFQVYIPIVKAYLEAVLGQIYNERNTCPLHRYKPLKGTARNQALCEIVEDMVDTTSHWYGYSAVLRQAIQQMLKYGIMVAFPREEWHCEKQIVEWDAITGPETIVVKEGLRYMLPHPTRMFADLQYPLTSLNTDSGCTYAGHWHILKYGDVLDNPKYWNRKSIFGGTNWFQAPLVGNYFNEIYPCRLKFLDAARWDSGMREDRASGLYTMNDRDKAVFVTEYFEKLVPDDWEMSNKADKENPGKGYKYPLWHRFVVAGDDTVIWAEPCAYNPLWFMGYDYDEMSSRHASFALELMPWQTQLGNILSQMLLTAKQNLLNVIFYNRIAVEKGDIDAMKNMGEAMYRGMMMIGYDPAKMMALRQDMDKVFSPVNLTKVSIQEHLQLMSSVLNIMERVLGISAQATGAAASHQQSKQEVIETSMSSGNRIQKISSAVDEGCDAWKRQLYDANMAYRDGTIMAEVSADIEGLPQHLDELGFKTVSGGTDSLLVVGHKKGLRIEGFANTHEGPKHDRDKEVAGILSQTITVVAGQPDLHKAIGTKNLLKLLEWAALLAGAPRDFKLRVDPNAKEGDEVPESVQKAIQQACQAVLQAVEEKLGKPIAQEMAGDKQKLDAHEQAIKKFQGIFQIAEAAQDKNKIKAEDSAAAIQRKDQAAQADQQRKDLAASKEQQRQDQKLIAELQATKLRLEADLHKQQVETAAALHASAVETAAKLKNDEAVSDAKAKAVKKPTE